jgi:hypothetical protein
MFSSQHPFEATNQHGYDSHEERRKREKGKKGKREKKKD